MAGRSQLVLTVSLAIAVCVTGGLIWKAYGPAAPPVVVAPPPPQDTGGRHMDLDLLTDQDLAFLGETLRSEDPAARRSAARALLLSERLEGAALLFDAAGQGHEDGLMLCLAGLEILRLQRAPDTLRELLLALRNGGNLPEGCRVEVADRFGLISRGQLAAVLDLADDPEPQVRVWVAETAAQREESEVTPVLVGLVADPEVLVRRSAWLGLQGRSLETGRAALVEAAAAEQDPRNRDLVAELGL